MRKLTILFTLLTLSAGLWAETQNVSYIYPVYNTDGDATSGIKEWESTTENATVVTSSENAVTWNAGWYVVTGEDVQLSQGAVCNGEVHLILADGAKLTANGIISKQDYITTYTPGIQVSGDNSLAIYAQSIDEATMGQLVANGVEDAAGIGGEYIEEGSNITINGGVVTANGGKRGAGIGGGFTKGGFNITINGGIVTAKGGNGAAGIGGGGAVGFDQGVGKHITINGGKITANGGDEGAGIGGGAYASGSNITINDGDVRASGGNGGTGIGNGYDSRTPASNIKVATILIIEAGSDNPPTTMISNLGLDIANDLNNKRYAMIVSAKRTKDAAIAAVNATIAEEDNDNVKAIATNAGVAINAAASVEVVEALKTQAIDNIASAKAAYNDGKAEAQEALPTDPAGTTGTAAVITKGEKNITLINPDKVEYIKITK